MTMIDTPRCKGILLGGKLSNVCKKMLDNNEDVCVLNLNLKTTKINATGFDFYLDESCHPLGYAGH